MPRSSLASLPSTSRAARFISSAAVSVHRHSGSRAQRASPESITTIGSMDSGPAPSGASTMCNCTSGNDRLHMTVLFDPNSGQREASPDRLMKVLHEFVHAVALSSAARNGGDFSPEAPFFSLMHDDLDLHS